MEARSKRTRLGCKSRDVLLQVLDIFTLAVLLLEGPAVPSLKILDLLLSTLVRRQDGEE